MNITSILGLFLLGLSFSLQATPSSKPAKEKPSMSQTAPKVILHTNLGDITLQLNAEKAPETVKNFLGYVTDGHYDGTIFHRVIPNFMAQGGGFTEKWQQKATKSPVRNEADNGLKNTRGTIAMARTSDPQSATAQFFINYKDNDFLNYSAPNPQGWGYAVFGEVVEGMDVVDKMATMPTGSGGPMPTDVPQTPIVIEKASVADSK